MVYEAWKKMGKDVVATSPFSERVFDFISPGGIVLDLGCGIGRISKLIKDHGYQTYGIDINADAIYFAQRDQNGMGINFSVQDSKKTDFNDHFFDAVIEQATLACMEREERIETLKEMHRIMKPHGVLSIAEFGIQPGKEDKYARDAVITQEYGTKIIRKKDGSEWFRSHAFEQMELEHLITNAGFQIIEEMHPTFPSINGSPDPGHQYIAKRM